MHYARMTGHDYHEGYYFVTINTAPRRNCLSRIAGGKVELLPFGEIVLKAYLQMSADSPEIDLRGMESLEAVLAAERYIDSAVMAKQKTVTIIHGKGTGALREAVRQMLKKNKLVKSYRQGLYGEGEAGVTVVELK